MNREDELDMIINGLCDNYTAVELYSSVSRCTGTQLSAKQIDYAARRDYDKKEKERAWKHFHSKAGKVYSAEDFPDYVVESMLRTGFDSPNDALLAAIKHDLKRRPEVAVHFFDNDGTVYFDDNGYRWIISVSLVKDWVSPEDRHRWMEHTGLYSSVPEYVW